MKVEDIDYDEQNKEVSNKASIVLKSVTATVLVVIIIINSKKIITNLFNKNNISEDNSNSIVYVEPNNFIDYTYVEQFYQNLLYYKNLYGNDFVNKLNTIEDVKNLYNFIIKFDDMYTNQSDDTNITSIEEYENILNSYFESCIKYDIKPFLSLMFYDKTYYYDKLSEAENLVYDLKNSNGNDYTIANKYFTWLGINLWDGRSAIKVNKINAPYIYLLMTQYKNYKNCGNVKSAIKNQKNNTLNINGNLNFSCPAGIDQFIRGYKVYDEYGNLIDSNDFHEVLIDLINEQCLTYQNYILKRSY